MSVPDVLITALIIGVCIAIATKRLEKKMATIEEQLRALDTKNDANWDAAAAAFEDLAGDIREIKEQAAGQGVPMDLLSKMEQTAAKGDSFVAAIRAAADEIPEPTPDLEPTPEA